MMPYHACLSAPSSQPIRENLPPPPDRNVWQKKCPVVTILRMHAHAEQQTSRHLHRTPSFPIPSHPYQTSRTPQLQPHLPTRLAVITADRSSDRQKQGKKLRIYTSRSITPGTVPCMKHSTAKKKQRNRGPGFVRTIRLSARYHAKRSSRARSEKGNCLLPWLLYLPPRGSGARSHIIVINIRRTTRGEEVMYVTVWDNWVLQCRPTA